MFFPKEPFGGKFVAGGGNHNFTGSLPCYCVEQSHGWLVHQPIPNNVTSIAMVLTSQVDAQVHSTTAKTKEGFEASKQAAPSYVCPLSAGTSLTDVEYPKEYADNEPVKFSCGGEPYMCNFSHFREFAVPENSN